MLPISNNLLLEPPKSHELLLNRKHSFNLYTFLQPYISGRTSRAWLIGSFFLLHILLLLALSLPGSVSPSTQRLPFPISLNISAAVAAPSPVAFSVDGGNDQCSLGKVYVYDLPAMFNKDVIQNCSDLNPWASSCEAISNGGLGRQANGLTGLVPEDLIHAWHWTDQFALELIYHNRMMNYRCRTNEPESAEAFYIPFYVGLAVGKLLWSDDYTAEERDRHCKLMVEWVQSQPFWNRSDGWDHFITMGRITWDFRRSKDKDWGSGCIYLPGMRNITRLLIERNPWDYFDVGVPYPTGFHPSSATDVEQWQHFVRTRSRTTLYSFAGGTRRFIKNDFRGILLSQCHNDSGSCRVMDCATSKCSNGTAAILEMFLDSEFCLQPRGDSFTRRSIFDCLVAGSIPVYFWKRTAYYQYQWFLPGEPGSYSVFIHRDEVRNGSMKEVLKKFSKEDVNRMRDKVIEYIPKIVYAKPNEGLSGIKDAFDSAIEGVLKRIKEQEKEGFKWK